jgi:hypothetical protein
MISRNQREGCYVGHFRSIEGKHAYRMIDKPHRRFLGNKWVLGF